MPVLQSDVQESESARKDKAREQQKREIEEARAQMEDMRSDMMIMGGILVLLTIGVGGWLLLKRIQKRDQ